MKNTTTKRISLVLSLLLVLSVMATPLFALEGGRQEAAQSLPQSEPAPEDIEQSVSEPEDTQEGTDPPLMIEGAEPFLTISIGGEAADGEPATGGSLKSLLVSVVYPKGKDATVPLKKGDEITLVFSLKNYEAFTGTFTQNGVPVEVGIGAYELALTYSGAFDVTGVTSNFTSSTTPKLANLSYNENAGADVDTLRIVALFSEKVSGKVQALNAAALGNTNGQFVSVKLKLAQDLTEGAGILSIGVDGVMAICRNGNVDEQPFTGGGELTQQVGYDTAAPVITAKNSNSENEADRDIPLNIITTQTHVVDPGAKIEITDSNVILYTVKKGTANYTTADTNPSDYAVEFTLSEPGVYTVTATDTAGNTATGKVTVTPRVTAISVALKGTVDVGGVQQAYIGTSFTATPTLSPAIATLPVGDKAVEWVVYSPDGITPTFITASGTSLTGPEVEDENTLVWTQTTAEPVTFAVQTYQGAYTLTARSVTPDPTIPGQARAASAPMAMASPAKINSVTIKAAKPSISSAGEVESVEITGIITAQGRVVADGLIPDVDDFAQVGCEVISLSANEDLATVGGITFSPAVAGKSGYAYPYTMTLTAEQDARGICDVTVSCGGIAAQTAVNISNYGVNYTKMSLSASSVGLDYQKNHSATLYINLTDAKNASDTIVVYPEDCEFTSDNTNLLAVDILKDGATVMVREGAQYLTAATKVTVTAALKNDPQGRKATFAFTVYPTERADWIEIYEVTASPNVTVSYGNTELYTDNLAEQAQLNVRVLGQQTDGTNGETVITTVNKSLVKFTSSNAKVAAVSDTGLITFKGYGESIVTVTATDGSGSNAQIKVLVNKGIEYLIHTSPSEVIIPPGGKQQFKITGTVPADATNSKLTGITWEVVRGDTEHFTLNTKTGLVTVNKNAPNGARLTIGATVPNLALQEDPLALVDMPRGQEFDIVVQETDANQLKAFSALNPKTIEAEVGNELTVSVANAAFTADAQWVLDWADGSGIHETGASFTFTPDRTGKATLYASYGGKTLTTSVIIYDPALPKAAKLSLAVEDGSNDYTLYDRYTETQLRLKAADGTNVENVKPEDAIFTSSHPGLVAVGADGSLAVNTEAVALTVTKDTKVTITAQVDKDPYARKVTKVITVTNKILPDSIGQLNFYNESDKSANTADDFMVDLSTLTNKSFATALSIDRRSMGAAFCYSKAVEAAYSGSGDSFLLGSNEYEQVFAALTFSSSNTKVATVDKFGVVTIKGAGTAVIKAEQLKGTYDAKTQTPAVATRTIVVEETTTALTLSHSAYTVVEGGTKPVALSLKATTTPKTAAVTWRSTNESVATVDAAGKVTIAAGLAEGQQATIIAESGELSALCVIRVTAAGKTVEGANKLTAANKRLIIDEPYYLYIRSNVTDKDELLVKSSNTDVLDVITAPDDAYNSGTLNGYCITVTPKEVGSATVTVSISGKTYSETFSVYKYDLSGTALTLTPSHGLLLDEWSARPENENAQRLAVILTDKTKNTLAEVSANDIVFTSSNPVLLPVKPDGTYHLRNLNTITKLTTVTVTATMKGETGARTGKITFKVSPTTSAASKVTITHRSDKDDFIKNMILVGDTELSKVIYTDVGDMAAQTVFSLGARIDRTNDTSVMLAESKQITWKSSDTKVATVDANGTVTAKAKGTAVITATAKDGSELSDRITLRVNHTAVVTNSLPMMEGSAQAELLGGSSYTIPYKLAPINGDIIIAGYEVQSGGDYITLDAKKGTIKAAKVPAEQTAVVTVKLAANKVYTPHGSGEEQLNDGDAVLDDINLTLRILPAATVKAFGLYDSAAPTKTVTKLDIPMGTTYTLIMKGTDTDNAPILDFGQVLYAAERTTATVNMIDGLDISRDEHELTLTPTAPGTYKLTASLGGKAVTCTVNVLYTMPSTSGDKPFAAKDKLEGAVILRADGAQLPLAKLCAGDTEYDVGTYVGVRAAGWGSDWIYNEDIVSFKSSSPLVTVAADGKVTVARYIPKETKVTITATLKNDPAKHTVSIPITVTSQTLTREMMLYRGAIPIAAEDTVTLLADKTSLRLSAVCKTIDGYTADNTAVTWKSSNTKAATVDKNGVVKLTGKGTTVITAAAADGGGAETRFTLVLT